MKGQIRYTQNGNRHYYLNGQEVDEAAYLASTAATDAARLEEMFATGKPPHGISDCTFMNNTANGRQFEGQEHIGDHYRQVATEAGISTTGKKYVSGLAAFPGDPEAWVDSRGDVERLLARRGWGCEGTINVAPRDSVNPPTPGPDVADDILDRTTVEVASRYPNPEQIDLEDLREQVHERIAPPKRTKVSKAAPEHAGAA